MIVGLDSNILCYSLDPAYPEHRFVKDLLLNLSPDNLVAVNPTVIHETYHALVFGQKWVPREASRRLGLLLKHPYVKFLNQTKEVTSIGLRIAVRYGLGGRDSLILANFISNRIPVIYTHDSDILSLGEIDWRGWTLRPVDPVALGDQGDTIR